MASELLVAIVLQSSKNYLEEVPKQSQLAAECQAHSEDQICTVIGRINMDIMWI